MAKSPCVHGPCGRRSRDEIVHESRRRGESRCLKSSVEHPGQVRERHRLTARNRFSRFLARSTRTATSSMEAVDQPPLAREAQSAGTGVCCVPPHARATVVPANKTGPQRMQRDLCEAFGRRLRHRCGKSETPTSAGGLHRLRLEWGRQAHGTLNTFEGILREFGVGIPRRASCLAARSRPCSKPRRRACRRPRGARPRVPRRSASSRKRVRASSAMATVAEPALLSGGCARFLASGVLTATALVALRGDVQRSLRAAFASYLGLTPREHLRTAPGTRRHQQARRIPISDALHPTGALGAASRKSEDSPGEGRYVTWRCRSSAFAATTSGRGPGQQAGGSPGQSASATPSRRPAV